MKAYFADPKRQIAALKPLLGSRQDLPAVRNYLFEAAPEGLFITATDLEVGLSVYHPAQVTRPGKAIVPESVVDLLEGEEVMTLAVEEQALSVQCGGFTRRCPFLSPEEFPELPSPNGNGNVFLSPDALGQLLGVGRFLAGGEDPRAIDSLQVKWAPGEDGKARVTATGTDGFKLCRTSVSGRSDGAGAALLTRRALAALNTLVDRAGEEPVKLWVAGDKLFASAGKDWLWASLRIGRYPDVSEILKVVKNTKISGSVEFKAFSKGVDRSLLAVKEEKAKTAHNAMLTVEPGKLSISFSSQEAGSGEALIPFQTDSAEKMTIPYNLNVLDNVLSGLRALDKNLETCQVSLSSPTSPMAISAATSQGPVLALVMPVA
jgi:DNA polymerase III sliding clamp (beta) subunit (PCNA family)